MIELAEDIFQLVITFLILVPGFLTYQIALFYGKISPDVDRFQQVAWSLVGSGLSISVTAVLTISAYNLMYGIVHGELIGIPDVSITSALILFPILVIVAIGLGILAGVLIDRRLRSRTTDLRESTWRYTKSRAEEPIRVRVYTNSGVEILGEVLNSGSKQVEKDILLQYPYRIHREQGEQVDKTDIGNFVYIPETDIAHIYIDSDIIK